MNITGFLNEPILYDGTTTSELVWPDGKLFSKRSIDSTIQDSVAYGSHVTSRQLIDFNASKNWTGVIS